MEAVETIIKTLHPLEIKVLLHMETGKKINAEILIQGLSFNLGQCNQVFSWLSAKELLAELERFTVVSYEITELGENYYKQGSPEERIVALIMKSPQQMQQIKDFSSFSAQIKEVLDYIKTNPDIYSESAKFLEKLKEKFPQLADDLNHLCFRAEIEEHNIEPEEEVKICLAELKTLEIKAKLDEISFNIKKAEQAKDADKVKELMSSFNKLANELNNEKDN